MYIQELKREIVKKNKVEDKIDLIMEYLNDLSNKIDFMESKSEIDDLKIEININADMLEDNVDCIKNYNITSRK